MFRLFAFVLAMVLFSVQPMKAAENAVSESAYDRVIRTNTLRCGYGIYEPVLMKDPNSGQISGAAVDIMQAFSVATGIKVEWVEEVDWGQIAAALQSRKIDAMCAFMWPTPNRASVLAFTRPVFFNTMEAYVRADDTRFDNNFERINQPDVKIAVNDGDVSEAAALRLFPQAMRVAKPPMSGEALMLADVVAGKADIALTAPTIVTSYNAANNNALRQIPLDRPVSLEANVVGVDIHEQLLRDVIDNGLASLLRDGTVRKTLDRYFAPGAIRHVDSQQ